MRQQITYKEYVCLDEQCNYTVRSDEAPNDAWWMTGAQTYCLDRNRYHENATGHRIVERETKPYDLIEQ